MWWGLQGVSGPPRGALAGAPECHGAEPGRKWWRRGACGALALYVILRNPDNRGAEELVTAADFLNDSFTDIHISDNAPT